MTTGTMLEPRNLYQAVPPSPRTIYDDRPTLLYTWWCSMVILFMIFVRIAGRWVRTQQLFSDDWYMLASIIPMIIRLGIIHQVILLGTNNVDATSLTAHQIAKRVTGSKMVLAARIFFAIFIWTQKFVITEFYGRFTVQFWRKGFETGLKIIRWSLVVTFMATFIATLAECQPITHYWQVSPDPGPKCRQGLAQLLTMSTTNIITDILIVMFPLPAIVMSRLPLSRKLQLTSVFCLSLILVATSAAKINYLLKWTNQNYRTVWASTEMLAAAAATNCLVLVSFVRDRGPKRIKPVRSRSESDTLSASTRRGTRVWGSDEDLIRDVGAGLTEDLHSPRTRSRGDPDEEDLIMPHRAWTVPDYGGGPNITLVDMSTPEAGPKDRPDRKVSWVDGYLTPDLKDSSSQKSDDSVRKQPVSKPRRHDAIATIIAAETSHAEFRDVGGLLRSNRSHSDAGWPHNSSHGHNFAPYSQRHRSAAEGANTRGGQGSSSPHSGMSSPVRLHSQTGSSRRQSSDDDLVLRYPV